MNSETYVHPYEAILSSSLDGDGPFVIHGVAIGDDDVTLGSSGVKKKWPAQELEKAAEGLAGQPLVKDHNNGIDGVIGRVTKAKYTPGVGVLYEAEISTQFKSIAGKVADGLLDVSIRAYHNPTEELDEDEDGTKIVSGIKFDNLSVVSKGASPSNTAQIGPATMLSASELQAEFDYDGADVEEIGQVDSEEESTEPTSEGSEPARMESDVEVESDEELASWSFHKPSWSGKTEGEWSQPDMSDFKTDDLGKISKHYILSRSGFPPDKFTDLSLPIVEPDGRLSLGGLRAAIGGHGVTAVDGVSSELEAKVKNFLIKLAKTEFGKEWDGESSQFIEGEVDTLEKQLDDLGYINIDEPDSSISPDDETDEATVADGEDSPAGGDLSGLNASLYKYVRFYGSDDDLSTKEALTVPISASRPGDRNLTEDTKSTMSDETFEAQINDMDDPVVIEAEDLESLKEQAAKADTVSDRLEEMSASLTDLSEVKTLVDEAGMENVESLAAAEDPLVIEAGEFEAQKDLVGEVKTLYAEALAEVFPMSAEMLAERFDVLELRDLLAENQEAELNALTADDEPDVKGGSAEEDELERSEEEAEAEEAEVADEELRESYASHYDSLGWSSVAEKVRSGEITLDELGAN